ncbi:MAG TPA: GNAT family protein [Polyangia bacterium]|nr:GNAT family protein [Polyangia bacterium]
MERRPLPDELKSESLRLHCHTLAEASLMFSCVQRDRERLRRFLPWVDDTKTVGDERAFIELSRERWSAGESFNFSLYRQHDSAYIGNVGVHSIAWMHNRCELGYWILGEYEGQGYMSEAVACLETACFTLGFNRVEIRCSSANARSANIPKRLGYQLDGILREDMIEDGEYRDTLIFAKLRKETATAPPRPRAR